MIIYPTEQFVSGVIPNRSDFPKAAKRFQDMSIDDFLGVQVASYMIYGSYSRGDHSRGSDIDALVVLRDRAHIETLAAGVQAVHTHEGVAIQTRTIVVGDESDQPLESNFHVHFANVVVKGQYLGQNPLDFISSSSTPADIAARLIIAAYQGSLRNKYMKRNTSPEAYASFLKSLAEKPFHAMREVLHCNVGVQNDARVGIVDQFRDEYPDLAVSLDSLRTTVSNYVSLLDCRQDIPIRDREEQYETTVGSIASNFFAVDAFYRNCLVVLDALIESKRL